MRRFRLPLSSALGVSGRSREIKILNHIGAWLRKPKPEHFRRWSLGELEEKKQYFESKDPRDWTNEDHYLAVEWVYQRYLPKGSEPSPERWQEVKRDFCEKIDRNIELSMSGKPLPKIQDDDVFDPEFQKELEKILSSK